MIARFTAIILVSIWLNVLYAGQPLDKVVALVNDKVITESELDDKVTAAKQHIVAKKIPMPEPTLLRKQVLEQLIAMELQMQLLEANNAKIEDPELDAAIEKIARSNKISIKELRSTLASEGLSWEEYRKNLRKEIALHHIQQQAVAAEVAVTNKEVDDYFNSSKNSQKEDVVYQLENLVIALPEEPNPQQLSEAKEKAQQVFDAHTQYKDLESLALGESTKQWVLQHHSLGERHIAQLPELYAKEVVKMKVGDVRGPLRAGNGFQLIRLVDAKGNEQAHTVTKTKVRHILIKQNAGTTTAEAQKRVHNLYQQMQSGKNFASMAKKYSVDVSSAVNGGVLGWVSPGETVPEFENAMNALKINEISKPIKTPFGWHLIQVLARKKEDDSEHWKKQKIREYLYQRKFSQAIQSWQQRLKTEAYIQVMDKDLR